jgi:hypothetical protein
MENAANGGWTGQGVVKMWLGNSNTRATILGEGYLWSLRYAACGQDGNQWNMEFAE